MKTVHSVLALSTVIFIIATGSTSFAQTTPTAEEIQSTVDSIRTLQSAIVWDEETTIAGEGFDANSYFDVFQHLQMDPGYVLDWVYQMDGLGGFPILYARQAEAERFENLEAYDTVAEGPNADDLHFRNHLVPDGTDMSYFEVAILMTIGGQYNLFWHANYNDTMFVLTPERLEAVIAGDYSMGNQPMPDDVASDARDMDLAPIIERGETGVNVGLVVFSNWGGFSRWTYSIPTAEAGQVTEITLSRETLVTYECGIMF